MSTSAADPADLQTFVTNAGSALGDLITKRDQVNGLAQAFRSLASVGMSDGGTNAAASTYIAAGQALDKSVTTVRHAFLAADSGKGTHSLSDATIASALAAAGAGIPTGPPVTVDTAAIQGQPVDSGVADDPVNVANGNFVEVETDLTMPGRAVAAAWIRTYNSRRFGQVGSLGRGWSCWADAGLAISGESLQWTRADGAVVPLPLPALGHSADLPQENGSVAARADGYVLTLPNQREEWWFDSGGRPTRIVSGNTEAHLTWEADRLVRVEHPRSGRHLNVGWSQDGRIDTVTTSDGRIASYTYEDGDLVAADTPESGRRVYETSGGLIQAVTDADGIQEVRNTYDEDGRVLTQLSGDGRLSKYVYRPGLQTIVTDEEGSAFNGYQHDAQGRLLAVTDDAGGTFRREYDDHGRLVAVSSRGGARFATEYDAAGNTVRQAGPDESVATMEWDEHRRVVRYTDRTGRDALLRYRDDLRTPVEITDAAGTTTYAVNDEDLVTRVVDPDGVSTDFRWDADGQLSELGTPRGRFVLRRDAAGHLVGLDAPEETSARWAVDAGGRVLRQTDPVGNVTEIQYSSAGRPLAVLDPQGGRYETAWGPNGNVSAVTDPLGSTVAFGYDTYGNTTRITAPDGREFSFSYDGLSRLTAATDPSGAATTREYDIDGNLHAITSPSGASIHRSFSEQGLPTDVVRPRGESAHNEFDAEGRCITQTAVDGSLSRLRYDAAGRLESVVDGAGEEIRLTWSPGGRLLSATTSGGVQRQFSYDECGRLREVRWSDGLVEALEHDALGRLVRRQVGDGPAEVYRYDAAGNVVVFPDGRGGDVTISYDVFGQPLRVVEDGRVMVAERDARGALTSVTDGRGARSDFRHDECGRRVAATGPLGGEWQYGYDAIGRLAAVTDPAGRVRRTERDVDGQVVADVQADGSGTRWWLDVAAQRVGAGTPDATEPADRFSLDARGQIVAASGESGRLELAYDHAGEITALEGPDGGLRWDRDADGAIVGVTASGGASAHFRRDEEGRVVGLAGERAHAADGPSWNVERDGSGQLVSAERIGPGRETFSWQWDTGGRLLRESAPRGAQTYTYDDAGQLVSSTDGLGSTRYRYDGAGRRTEESTDDGQVVRYRWDGRGRLQAIEREAPGTTVSVTQLAYDALGMLCRVGGKTVQCDPNAAGAPVRVVDGDLIVPVGGEVIRLGPGGARVPVAEAARDPFGLPIAPQTDALQFGPHGELGIDGLLFLGARMLDPRTRSFLSPDPLAFAPGTPEIENPYCYAYNDPTRWLDPAGLKPLSEAALKAQWDSKARGAFGNAWQAIKKDPWGTLGAVAVIAAGVGLEFVPGCQTMATGILIGAGGAMVMGLATGTFNPRTVMMGGIMGGAVGIAGPAAAVAIGGESAGVVTTAAVGMGIGGAAGGVGTVANDLLNGEPITAKGVLAGAAGGAGAGGLGSLAGSSAGTLARGEVGGGTSAGEVAARQAMAGRITPILNAGAGAAGATTTDLVRDGRVSPLDVASGAAGGAAGGKLGDAVGEHVSSNSPNTMRTLAQADRFGPQSVRSVVTQPGPNSRYIATSAGVAGGTGAAVDTTKDAGKAMFGGGGGEEGGGG